MKHIFRFCAVLLVCTALCLSAAVAVGAYEALEKPAETGNLGDYAYEYDRWAVPINSYLVPHDDGTLTRVEYTGEFVTVEEYGADLQFISGFSIQPELPLFGGFYSGQTHNFMVFGQENDAEDDTVEVFRVVCYTKDWQRVGADSLYGANTTIPFKGGSLRFAECNGYLYIRTAHRMYTASDGNRHQANVMINFRIADTTITEACTAVSNQSRGYVSHSFNQFVAVDGTDLLAVDHGDAYPRSVVLFRYHAPAGQDSIMQGEYEDMGDYYQVTYLQTVNVLPIDGQTGANDTGVALGGFDVSADAYLIAGNTVFQEAGCDLFGQRNIFVSATSKTDFSESGTTIRYLTDYVDGDNVELSTPHFVKVSDGRYVVLWTETTDAGCALRFCFVDGQGCLQGQIYNADGVLSDCKPVVSGDKLVWYATSGSAPAFFTIDLKNPEVSSHQHIYQYEFESYPWDKYEGSLSSVCAVCGGEGPSVVVPALSNTDAYTLAKVLEEPTCTASGSGYFTWNDAKKYGVTNYYYTYDIPAVGHTFIDGICECGKYALQHVGATLTLESEVKYNLYFKLNDPTVKLENVGLLTFLTEPSDATIDNASFVLNNLFYDSVQGYNALRTQGVPAKEMGDTMYLRLYATLDDGTVIYGKLIPYSAKTFATSILEKSSDEALKNTVVALMNYGAEAQKLLGYKTDSLMNADIPAEYQDKQVAYKADLLDGRVKAEDAKVGSLIATEGAFTGKNAQVTLNGALAINYLFVPGKTVDNGKMTMYFWTASTYASVDVLTLDNADSTVDAVINGSYYHAVYEGIAAKELDDTVYVLAVYESEGEICMSGVVSYSIEQFCRSQVSKASQNQALCEKLTIYSYYAKIYFNVD